MKKTKKNYKISKFSGRQVLESRMLKISKSSKMRKEIAEVIMNNDRLYDLTDVGNEIGIIIGKYTNRGKKRNDNWKTGYDKDDFIHGIEHGISLSDGTH